MAGLEGRAHGVPGVIQRLLLATGRESKRADTIAVRAPSSTHTEAAPIIAARRAPSSPSHPPIVQRTAEPSGVSGTAQQLPEGVYIKKYEPREAVPGEYRREHPNGTKPVNLYAERKGVLWGRLGAQLVTEIGEKETTPDQYVALRHLEVPIDKRNQGVGSALLREMETQARDAGATRVKGTISTADLLRAPSMPEYLASRGYTVTNEASGFIFYKSLNGQQSDSEIIADEPQPDRVRDRSQEIMERRLRKMQRAVKELRENDYYSTATQYDVPYASKGVFSYRSPDGRREGIIINRDILKNSWGEDFTVLTDVLIYQEAMELLLTKGKRPDKQDGFVAEHQRAILAASEKAHQDGLLDLFLTLRERQMQFFAIQGESNALDELTLYRNIAMHIKERESTTSEAQRTDHSEVVILRLAKQDDPLFLDQEEVNSAAVANVVQEHAREQEQLSQLEAAHARQVALEPFIARLREITEPTGQYALAIKGIAEDLDAKRIAEEAQKIEKERREVQERLDQLKGISNRDQRKKLRDKLVVLTARKLLLTRDGKHTMLGILQNPKGNTEENIPIFVTYRTGTTRDPKTQEERQFVIPIAYGQFAPGQAVHLKDIPRPLLEVGFNDQGEINSVTDRTLPFHEGIQYTGIGAQISVFLQAVADLSGDGYYTFEWQDLASDPKFHTHKYGSYAGQADYVLNTCNDGLFEETQGTRDGLKGFSFDIYLAMVQESMSKIRRNSLV